jgi:hypothetical protein
LGNHWGSRPRGRSQSGSRIESASEPQGDLSSEPKSYPWNDLRTESATESMSESEIQLLNDLWNESSSHLGVQSGIQSANHSQSDSASELLNDSWDDLPNAMGCDGSVSVRRSASGLESNATCSSDDCCAARADDDADVSPDGMGVPRRQFSKGERSLDSSDTRGDGRSLGASFDRRRDRGYWSSDDDYVDRIVGRRR